MTSAKLIKRQQGLNQPSVQSCPSEMHSVSQTEAADMVRTWIRERRSATRLNPRTAFTVLFARPETQA